MSGPYKADYKVLVLFIIESKKVAHNCLHSLILWIAFLFMLLAIISRLLIFTKVWQIQGQRRCTKGKK